MTFRSLRIVALALLASVAAASAQDVRIGFHAPQTGFAAADGKSAVHGAELAVEQINAQGGINGRKLALVVYDDQGRADQAQPIANRLLGDGVKLVISGSYSGPTRAAAGIFQNAKIPYVSAYAIHPDITRAGDYVFRTSFMGEVQGRAGAKLIGDFIKKKRVTMINLNNDFGQALGAGFKEAAPKFGLDIISEYNYGMSDRQFGSIVASVKRDNPDVIYASGYFFTAGPLVSQLRAGGVTATIVGQEGYDTPSFIDIAKAAAEGVIITTSLDRDSKDEEMRAFIDGYEKKYGVAADMVAATTHTAVRVAADALRRAGTDDTAKIREAISTGKVRAATGTIVFNDLGEITKNVQAQIIKNGKFGHFAVIEDPVLLAPPTR
jgi:branched-chain amino acid transport system substrate-binding protein